MLDTLLANFPNVHLVVVIDDDGLLDHCRDTRISVLKADADMRRASSELRDAARESRTTAVVVTRSSRASRPLDLYSIPADVSRIADAVVAPHKDGSYTVLKNRWGQAGHFNIPMETETEADSNEALPHHLRAVVGALSSARFMPTVYALTAGGVATSAGTAIAVASAPEVTAALTTGWLVVPVLVLPFALVIALGGWAPKMRPVVAGGSYLVLTALMGVWLSTLAAQATLDPVFASDVLTALLITSGMFAGLACVGWTTKRDLSGWGTFLLSALIGLIVAMVANFWMQSTGLQLAISSAAVLVFSALIAYDVQSAKRATHTGFNGAVVCALALYLDFINLFQHVLRLLGCAGSDD